MTYRDNVSALAVQAGVTNEPSLQEGDIWIKIVEYWDEGGKVVGTTLATDMNKAYRLYLQETLRKSGSEGTIICDALFLEGFKAFYQDLIDDSLSPDFRPSIYWTLNCYRITVFCE